MYQYPIKPNELYHYGMPHRSGRYKWGSGKKPFQSEEIVNKLSDAQEKKDRIATKRFSEYIMDNPNLILDPLKIKYYSKKIDNYMKELNARGVKLSEHEVYAIGYRNPINGMTRYFPTKYYQIEK